MLNIILPCHIVCNYNQYRTILNQLDLTFERYRSLYQWELVTVSLIKGFPHHTLKLIWEKQLCCRISNYIHAVLVKKY
ncbi:hypothetical protein OUZ56_014966 [Daphnia magna]|uniref:Uncharacterized protein n=1 Tax=Daphnia magna TaxID=35525 RepID=A0ABR0ALD5_9CRUS|nr:hypothetical protein OUZ56_014966 [Daphnia magna]